MITRGVFHLGISSMCCFQVLGSSSVFFGVFIAEEVDGVGDKGSGYTPAAVAQTLLEAFLNMSLRFDCFTDGFFLVKSRTFSLQTTLPSARLSDDALNKFSCTVHGQEF